MIEDYVLKRLQKEHEFHSSKLKNLFSHIFRDKDAAWAAWLNAVSRAGFDGAVKALRGSPQKFGKLKGRAWLGFLKDQAFRDRNRALSEAHRISEQWYGSHLQLDTAEVRVAEVKGKITATLNKEKERQRQRAPEREHERGR